MLDGAPTAATGSAGEPLAPSIVIERPVTGFDDYLIVATLATSVHPHRVHLLEIDVGFDPLDKLGSDIVEADSFIMHPLHAKQPLDLKGDLTL